MKIVLKNGRILDPSQDLDMVGDVSIVNDQIAEVGRVSSPEDADETYDCTGMWITPGLVDLHVHLREPGFSHKESIITGTQAAAAGGFTTICCMPNTSPPLDDPALIDFILDRSASPEAGGIFVAPIGALTKGMRGERPSDLASLRRAGIVAASDDAFPIQDAQVMLRCMELCRQLDLPVATHCEDLSLAGGGSMNEGSVSAVLGLKGMPRTAEEIQVARNCMLSLETLCPLHILHVSTWGSVEIIKQAKYLGAPVTCEVCPHHFSLIDEDMIPFDTNYKMNPPLRTKVDQDLILQAIEEGTIDCIATDHAPHAAHEKDRTFDEAPFGIVGLETAVGVTLTHLTHKGVLSPLETIRRLSTRPAEIFRLDAGTLKPGRTPVAQVTVIDPAIEWTFDVNKTFSKGKNSPYHGATFRGKPMLTFSGGEVYCDALWPQRIAMMA
ncbi:MAG: dihydroorotase [Armatimonadetes bacterium]|nr:dihydroorotase [Armatimonadota bacterium]NOG92961.1 dihydroorotase [Armatimonadota bacterium]